MQIVLVILLIFPNKVKQKSYTMRSFKQCMGVIKDMKTDINTYGPSADYIRFCSYKRIKGAVRARGRM